MPETHFQYLSAYKGFEQGNTGTYVVAKSEIIPEGDLFVLDLIVTGFHFVDIKHVEKAIEEIETCKAEDLHKIVNSMMVSNTQWSIELLDLKRKSLTQKFIERYSKNIDFLRNRFQEEEPIKDLIKGLAKLLQDHNEKGENRNHNNAVNITFPTSINTHEEDIEKLCTIIIQTRKLVDRYTLEEEVKQSMKLLQDDDRAIMVLKRSLNILHETQNFEIKKNDVQELIKLVVYGKEDEMNKVKNEFIFYKVIDKVLLTDKYTASLMVRFKALVNTAYIINRSTPDTRIMTMIKSTMVRYLKALHHEIKEDVLSYDDEKWEEFITTMDRKVRHNKNITYNEYIETISVDNEFRLGITMNAIKKFDNTKSTLQEDKHSHANKQKQNSQSNDDKDNKVKDNDDKSYVNNYQHRKFQHSRSYNRNYQNNPHQRQNQGQSGYRNNYHNNQRYNNNQRYQNNQQYQHNHQQRNHQQNNQIQHQQDNNNSNAQSSNDVPLLTFQEQNTPINNSSDGDFRSEGADQKSSKGNRKYNNSKHPRQGSNKD